ncbi:MAG: GNAT family N-acetyltransferase [Proteobacteria bacterium]|nr:GNAT family N-acetyltransferase [Pseudomonadota bacterium]
MKILDVELTVVGGNSILPFLSDLARLRIEVFKDFPYLYKGSLDYEAKYLNTYVKSQTAAIVLALDKGKVVGASTCLSLKEESESVKSPLGKSHYSIDDGFYFGESVLLKSYRGAGIGKAFFKLREDQARKCGAKFAVFCAVVREKSHPLKPANYVPLDTFWKEQGYDLIHGLNTTFSWRDLNQESETEKEMRFWLKHL